MMHKAWFSIEEVPYCSPRSSIKFLGHTGQNIVNVDPNGAFPDCNSSFNSPMDLKWCTKLGMLWKKCPIVFRGHRSNFIVTRAEKLTIWIQFEITTPVAAIKSLRFALLTSPTWFKMKAVYHSCNTYSNHNEQALHYHRGYSNYFSWS